MELPHDAHRVRGTVRYLVERAVGGVSSCRKGAGDCCRGIRHATHLSTRAISRVVWRTTRTMAQFGALSIVGWSPTRVKLRVRMTRTREVARLELALPNRSAGAGTDGRQQVMPGRCQLPPRRMRSLSISRVEPTRAATSTVAGPR